MNSSSPTEVQAQPVLNLTESAALRVRELIETDPANQGKTLRVFVENGGCSGMQYGLVFDEKRAEDIETKQHGVSVLVDEFSLNYLRGSVVDYVDSLTGGGFKISNPNARANCGCGKSFAA